ncbi:MAG: ABC transporter ATP-binding protein [Planctomycetaceae bacterium]
MSLVARELCKSFGPVRAVAGISFELAPGEIVGLIGPNGSGKSTVLRMLATFLRPTRGSAAVAGFDCVVQGGLARQCLGYLPEALPGYVDARVDEYLAYRAALKGVPRCRRRTECDRCLDACQLQGVRWRLLRTLSQGYRRRVGLADALLGSPAVLLLDEPTIGLDPLQVRATRELLRALAPQTTILLSTHLLTEAEALCTRALMLLRGRLISDVSLADLGSESGFEIELTGQVSQAETALRGVAGVRSVAVQKAAAESCTLRIAGNSHDLRERVVSACVTQGWGVRRLEGLPGSLEDHFVRMSLAPPREAA